MKRKMYFVLCLLLLLALCSCAGNEDVIHTTEEKNETTEPIADETTDPVNDDTTEPVNDVTTELTADTTAPAPDDVPKENQRAELTYTSGDFSLRTLETGAVGVRSLPIDSDRAILLLSMPDNRNEDGLYKIAVYNHLTSEYEFSKEIRSSIPLTVFSYYSGEYLFCGYVYMNGYPYEVPQVFALGNRDGEWYLTVKTVAPALRVSVPMFSPDGSLCLYWREVPVKPEQGIYDTQIFLCDSSGKEREILATEPYMHDKHFSQAWGYKVSSFIDDDNILVSIVGYEWVVGYGIYNISTDTITEVRTGSSAAIYKDGKIYGLKDYGRKLFMATGTGEPEEIQLSDDVREYITTTHGGLGYNTNGEKGGYVKNSYFFAKNRDLDSMRIYSPELELIAEIFHPFKAKEILYAEDYVVMIY